MKRLIFAFLTLLTTVEAVAAPANYCGDLANAYGPYDYRRRAEFTNSFNLVESAHFNSDVEQGVKGISGQLGGDLDYTLRAIPNHHRALASLANIAVRNRSVQVPGMRYPVECWFNRAVRFTPDDSAVYAIYGSYLFSLGKVEKSTELFLQGISLEPENINLNYNLGLSYVKQKKYELALPHAKKAYAAGFPLQGLKNKLIEAGQWEPAN